MKHPLLLVLLLAVLFPAVPVQAAPPKHRVIVVGGGLAGLVTAYELEKRGVDTVVLDMADRLGGRVATATYPGGLRAEYGMQEIWEKNPLLGLVKELGLKTESSDDPWSSLVIDGKLQPFVQETRQAYFEATFDKSERVAFRRALAELERLYRAAEAGRMTPELLTLQDMSFADWLDKQGLPPRVKQALRLTIEVELAAVAEQFSALSAVLEYRCFLFKGEKNYHVQGGNSRIIQELARHIRGPKILGARVTEVIRTRRKDGSIEARVRYMHKERLETVRGDAVVVAIPWVFMHFLQFTPDLSAVQWKAINGLGLGQYVVVHMRVDRKAEKLWKIGAEDPFPILSNGPLGVIYGPHDHEPGNPDTIFGLLIYGPEAQAYHMVPRDTKRAEIIKALDGMWPGFSRYVKDTEFYSYHPAAVAYWPPGRSPMDEGSRAIRTGSQGLYLAGDWTVSSHAEGAVVSALMTARAVAAYLQLPRQVAPRR